jgi:hypothetical protein
MRLVLLVPHGDIEAMLSVSAVRTDEGVLRIVVELLLLLLLEPNGEGGGVNSLKLIDGATGTNRGERGGDCESNGSTTQLL